ncbi:hypothetical protein OUZ56_002281 [Daphnia magna]|uniref:Uncharacterized protein n=1 Tax=Daphnia magna TaxID=35525 RepID=A0ABR0A5L4_9CRUS|nr:hypothetical protein OUZ56_002281 [Daphnia magna]
MVIVKHKTIFSSAIGHSGAHPHMGMESADTSPQFILSGPHFQSLHVRNGPHFIPKSTKNLSKFLGQSAGESPQFLLSAVRGPRPHFILAPLDRLQNKYVT